MVAISCSITKKRRTDTKWESSKQPLPDLTPPQLTDEDTPSVGAVPPLRPSRPRLDLGRVLVALIAWLFQRRPWLWRGGMDVRDRRGGAQVSGMRVSSL